LATLFAVLILQKVHSAQVGNLFLERYHDSYHFVLHLFLASNWGFQKGHSFNTPVWSVSVEVLLYALFFVFAIIRFNTILKLIAILISMMILVRLGQGHWFGFVAAVLAFFMGGFTYESVMAYLPHRSKCRDAFVVMLTLALWLGIISSQRVENFVLTRFQLHILVLFPLTIISLVLIEYEPFGRRLKWIGDISYSSYLPHFPL